MVKMIFFNWGKKKHIIVTFFQFNNAPWGEIQIVERKAHALK